MHLSGITTFKCNLSYFGSENTTFKCNPWQYLKRSKNVIALVFFPQDRAMGWHAENIKKKKTKNFCNGFTCRSDVKLGISWALHIQSPITETKLKGQSLLVVFLSSTRWPYALPCLAAYGHLDTNQGMSCAHMHTQKPTHICSHMYMNMFIKANILISILISMHISCTNTQHTDPWLNSTYQVSKPHKTHTFTQHPNLYWQSVWKCVCIQKFWVTSLCTTVLYVCTCVCPCKPSIWTCVCLWVCVCVGGWVCVWPCVSVCSHVWAVNPGSFVYELTWFTSKLQPLMAGHITFTGNYYISPPSGFLSHFSAALALWIITVEHYTVKPN